ncbi:uncharacterized protein EV154DRAFT_490584 [Mucor mucedo]|uniref:uncharacterized protein n=1 Tax=Mucor mucedo TaxID=29922 RepID=UPI00221EE462|nr:uncharacterized protein EV154DRAFT_490584 [Mucor mucedo]KAI7897147.1 hypothetical protein EV154DRAFT_490584 [Mucor mucedo]
MSYHCTICYDPIVKDNDMPACLGCGHTFHKSCITQWIASKSAQVCPLCKKRISKNKIISPIYLSTNDAPSAAAVDHSEVVSLELTMTVRRLQQDKVGLETSMSSLHKELEANRVEIQRLRDSLEQARTQRRYIKIIRKVAELDDDLSEEPMQQYLQSIQHLSSRELLIHVGALRARQLKAIKETEASVKRLGMQTRDNEILKAKIEELNQRLKGDNTSSPATPTSATSPAEQPEKKVIILDDSDGESDTVNLTDDYVDGEDSLDFFVEEHVAQSSNSRKRKNNSNENGEGERAKKIVAIDLSQDDDSAGPSRSRA